MPAGVYPRISGDELKKRLQELSIMQSQILPDKIKMSSKIIDEMAIGGKMGIMFSGGRDSFITAKLAAKYNPILIYCNTGLSSDFALQRVKSASASLKLELNILNPTMPAFEMWQKLGHFPIGPKRGHTYWKNENPLLKSSPVQCCYHLKEKPAKDFIRNNNFNAILWGNRASDSNRRKLSVADFGMINPPSNRWPCYSATPIACWTDSDVSEYLKNVDYFFESKSEDGCLVCCTDISRPDNQLTKTFIRNRQMFDTAILSGLGKQILHAQGEENITDNLVCDLLKNKPQRFLRVKK